MSYYENFQDFNDVNDVSEDIFFHPDSGGRKEDMIINCLKIVQTGFQKIHFLVSLV